MFRTAVVDDEENSRGLMAEYLRRFSESSGVQFQEDLYESGAQFLEKYSADTDIVFLDIEMPGLDGMETARELRNMDEEIIIVFVTNMARYAIKGYEVDAMDFIVKPVQYPAFERMLKKVLRFILKYKREESIFLKSDGEIRKVSTSDILYVEAAGSYVTYHTINGEYRVRGPLKNAEKELQEYGFLRCNHCYIINPRYVTDVKSSSVKVGGTELAVSRNRKKDFLNGLTEYLGKGMMA
ncbi:MAG TPA: LytTR family DNA-binding domain-containing protein [Candidatus Mediterraneibacter stercoripullorum]|nr:LytTR family DNA-binding domain-containing protein [Candidatus Mediterraneibacter stercoripullorum]